MIIQGRAWVLGDNVDTDQLLPARYLSLTDPADLAAHCLEGFRPDLRGAFRPGDLIVAGDNFGCGSSREHAPLALKGLGVSCVIARSFARIFFRNAINLGVPTLTSADAYGGIEDGDVVRIDLGSGEIEDLTRSFRTGAAPLPDFLREIIDAGGMTPYVRQRLQQER